MGRLKTQNSEQEKVIASLQEKNEDYKVREDKNVASLKNLLLKNRILLKRNEN